MSKKNNFGFSLVELIIVITIMAVLISVLAPQYLKYVEKSRVVQDEELADEIRRSCETILSDEDEKLEQGQYTITITPNADIAVSGTGVGCNPAHLDACLKQVLGVNYAKNRLVSKSYSQIQVVFSNTTRPTCNITYVNAGNSTGSS